MKQNKTYLHLGVTLIVSACAVLMFYDTFFQSRVLLDFFDKLMSVLSPVIYGLVFAYLLAPIVDFFDRYIQKGLPKVKSSLVRGLSILVTWICVIALIYLMFSILIPELVDSTKTLADNFESYYKTVYNWVNSLVENQTIFSDDIYSDQLLSALNGYYDKLVKWVTDTVIPQAQVAIVAVTGGIWSVVIFLKNLLIGMMISVYLLARKESFAKQSKKILYAILPETPYRRTLRAVAEKLLRRFGIDIYALKTETLQSDLFGEALTMALNGRELLQIGTVSRNIRRKLDVKQDVFYLEMNFEALVKSTKKHRIVAEELSKFPEVKRDLALLVDKQVTFSALRDVAFATERKLLKSVSLFDVYEGDKLPEGKKSYALSFILEDKTRTLDEKAIERAMQNLTAQFERQCGAHIRA